ncbi:YbdD/YjiX family protein [Thermoflavimicrobium daqui]|jgi:uncharacterized short protein YbdD (DUF466 family)|uniref:YbdD/YjiX family protein n=1 Tax=Thermoflavimicrobium daqui TaxID=2137476 RepID=A0A364K4U2_9BACL|nr:YbdD/YjiX family protein [Thermoflavimicrobium daqui]RAL24366.1 hypothetical protein DL897_08545 [Thermoflavimicrobium daqui]
MGDWKKPFRLFAEFLNTMAGVPSYQKYLDHFYKNHPGATPMSEAEFHRKANDEKYGGGTIRRCC